MLVKNHSLLSASSLCFSAGQRGEPGKREALLRCLDIPTEHALISGEPRRHSTSCILPAGLPPRLAPLLLTPRLRQAEEPGLQGVLGQQRL